MYKKLIAVAPLLNNLDATLSAPDAAMRVGEITSALNETAARVSDATQTVTLEEERIALQKLYRGLVAAKRIVTHLHELRHA